MSLARRHVTPHASASPPVRFPKAPHGTRAEQKAQRLNDAERTRLACYKAVDARDRGQCRVCGKRCSPTALAMVDRAERHHIAFRSQGGAHEPSNVLTLCQRCHGEIHTHGRLRLMGDADARDGSGTLAGVLVEVATDGRWKSAGLC